MLLPLREREGKDSFPPGLLARIARTALFVSRSVFAGYDFFYLDVCLPAFPLSLSLPPSLKQTQVDSVTARPKGMGFLTRGGTGKGIRSRAAGQWVGGNWRATSNVPRPNEYKWPQRGSGGYTNMYMGLRGVWQSPRATIRVELQNERSKERCIEKVRSFFFFTVHAKRSVNAALID